MAAKGAGSYLKSKCCKFVELTQADHRGAHAERTDQNHSLTSTLPTLSPSFFPSPFLWLSPCSSLAQFQSKSKMLHWHTGRGIARPVTGKLEAHNIRKGQDKQGWTSKQGCKKMSGFGHTAEWKQNLSLSVFLSICSFFFFFCMYVCKYVWKHWYFQYHWNMYCM